MRRIEPLSARARGGRGAWWRDLSAGPFKDFGSRMDMMVSLCVELDPESGSPRLSVFLRVLRVKLRRIDL